MFSNLYSISNYIFIKASHRTYLNVLLRDHIDLLKHAFTLEIACYTNTFVRSIRENYVIEKICKRL
jgi:hypothetical protein